LHPRGNANALTLLVWPWNICPAACSSTLGFAVRATKP
jgi:hypothetical protein